jgi:hypothetical protein
MSGFTQTTNELLYSYDAAATPSVPTTSPGATITAGYPPIIIPAGYFKNAGSQLSSSLKLEMGGLATATATVPTWQFFLYAAIQTTSAPAFATTYTLANTATFTPTAETNYWWFADINLTLRALALGEASTVSVHGEFRSPMFASSSYAAATPLDVTIPGSGSYSPFATYDTSQAYVLWPALSLSAATAGNDVTVQYAKLYGEN